MKNYLKKIIFIIAFILPLFNLTGFAQQTEVKQTVITGVITDATDKDPIPYVTVLFKGTGIITKSDADGKFVISTRETHTELQFSYVGYKSSFVSVKPGESQVINVKMQSESQSLSEVVISSNKRPA